MSTSTTPAFTFVTPQVILARNAGALYNYGLGNALMTSLASSTDLNGLLNSVYVNSIGTTATSVVASNLVRNLGITGAAAVTEAEAYVVAQLNPVAVSGRGVVINNILTAFSNLTGNATFGSFASAFNTQVASAVNYAATPGARDTDWAGAIRVTGQTFTLTAGAAEVNEGGTSFFTLSTKGVTAGTQYAYAIKGVSGSDLSSGALAGTATVGADGKAIIAVSLANDTLTEDDETMTLEIAGQTASVTVKDTSVSPPAAYTLTAGVDNLTGTIGNDFFDGSNNQFGVQTLTSGDSVDGGAGDDTIIVGGAAVGAFGTPSLKNIEALRLLGSVNVDLFSSTGYKSISLENGTAGAFTSTLTSVASADVGLNVTNQSGSHGTLINFTNAALAGTADSVKVSLISVDQTPLAGSTGLTLNQTAGANSTGLESLVLESSGSSRNRIDSINGQVGGANLPTITKLTVSGSQPLVVTQALQNGVTNVDASAATGGVTAILGTVAAATNRVVSVTGGDGNDTFTVSAVAADLNVNAGKGNDTISVGAGVTLTDSINGGDGTDTLTTTAAITAAQAVNVTNFETLRLTGQGAAFTQSAAAVAGITAIQLDGTNVGVDAFTVSNQGVQTINVRAAVGADTVTVTPATDTANDTITVSLNTATAAAGVTVAQLALDSYEVVKLSATADTANSANTITRLDGGVLKTLEITNNSSGTLTVLNTGGAAYGNLTSIDGSASSGALALFNAGVALAVASNIKGGDGNDSIQGSSGNDTISGGAGSDSVVGNGGSDNLSGEAGNDTLTGGAGNDTISGGDGDDSITAGAGNDSLSGGDGSDVFSFNTTAADTIQLTSGDKVDGGNGTDLIALNYGGAHAINLSPQTEARLSGLSNVEGIRLTVGGNNGASLALGDISLNAFGGSVAITHATGDTGSNTVDASQVISNTAKITYTGSTDVNTYSLSNGIDVVSLGAGADVVLVTNPLFLSATDTLSGGAGADSLTVTAGSAAIALPIATLANVTGFETVTANFVAGSAGSLSFTLSDAFAAANRDAVTGNMTFAVTEGGGSGGLSIDGSAVLAGSNLLMTSTSRVDNLVGGAGNDVFTVAATNLNAGEVINGGTGTDIVRFTGANSLNGVTFSGVEVIDFNSASIVAITALASVFNGQTYAITESDASNEVNTITLNPNGVSTLDFSKVTASVSGTQTTAQSANDQIIVSLAGAANTNLAHSYTGSGLADYVTGGLQDDTISGGSGADSIDGGSGNDSLSGGTGNDTLVGGVGDDTIIGGTGRDSMTGSAGIDTFVVGATGSSVAAGNSGTVLTAGAIANGDVISFVSLDPNTGLPLAASLPDVIADFVSGIDKLDVANAATAATSLVGVALANTTTLNTTFSARGLYNPAGTFTISATGPDTILYVGDGSLTFGTSTGLVVLSGVAALVAGDFV